jgi:hypothetical protein
MIMIMSYRVIIIITDNVPKTYEDIFAISNFAKILGAIIYLTYFLTVCKFEP